MDTMGECVWRLRRCLRQPDSGQNMLRLCHAVRGRRHKQSCGVRCCPTAGVGPLGGMGLLSTERCSHAPSALHSRTVPAFHLPRGAAVSTERDRTLRTRVRRCLHSEKQLLVALADCFDCGGSGRGRRAVTDCFAHRYGVPPPKTQSKRARYAPAAKSGGVRQQRNRGLRQHGGSAARARPFPTRQ